MTKQLCALFLLLLAGLFAATEASAQTANLSFQGILKKANGLAVDDGTYDITFILYDAETGGAPVFTETKMGVEVAGGIYSVILGSVATPLNAPFDVPYYLGIRVGGPSAAEMVPRIRLTSAPYALSLIGSSNIFPGSGTVQADKIEVNGGVLAEGGAPGSNGALNNGYAFKDGGGDNDSGLFSTADGQVSLYANNSELLRVSNPPGNSSVNIKTNALIDNSLSVLDQLSVGGFVGSDLNFANQRGLKYNGLSDWRLVDRDDFEGTSHDGWVGTESLVSTTDAPIENVSYGDFNGRVIRPTSNSNDRVLKKQFNLSGVGSFTYVKVRFKYYYTDSWDAEEDAYAGFATDLNATNPVICWANPFDLVFGSGSVTNYTDESWSDAAAIGEMVAYNPGTSFYVFVGARLSGSTTDERYALGNVEVWVR